ncbi:Adenylyltransferase and sulfurtransferase uba4 [Cyphellophora attinorum]|uniref:Adenylyltransferase and sulfurtransferase uba4 n=1 Tax=Cyphellophora attinorum TaxID=1664694 RepID=A0A0N1HIC9_9EURO|nr:Adenylyltransferase and sulfurtransferase uba4 [Phialophora attinorum]KPI46062.1 Adenylyltransferase and sulfurtransferase uba4 [Phialophora attinorum]
MKSETPTQDVVTLPREPPNGHATKPGDPEASQTNSGHEPVPRTQIDPSSLPTRETIRMNGAVASAAQAPSQSIFQPPDPLTLRYARQLLLPQLHGLTGQKRLQQSRILIIGLGGLGCPAALYLAAAGVGTLGFVDGDVVEESNLHRQVLHSESRVGMEKCRSAREGVKAVNSGCVVEVYGVRVGGREVLGILEGWVRPDGEADEGGELQRQEAGLNGDTERPGRRAQKADGRTSNWDLVLDCTDNPATRYAINDAAMLCDVPLVSGAAQRGEGMLMVLGFKWAVRGQEDSDPTSDASAGDEISAAQYITNTSSHSDPPPPRPLSQPIAGRGPCYRCIYPVPPDPTTVASCAEIGVLGTAVGTIGTLMAQEALKLLVLPNETRVLAQDDLAGRRGEMLLVNAFSAQGLRGMFRGVGLRGRRKGCLGCVDYEEWCGRVEDVRVLSRDRGERVTARAFLEGLRTQASEDIERTGDRGTGKVTIVDVREEIEVELGARLEGATNLPFSRIHRDPEEAFAEFVKEENSEAKVYFVCQRGNDSQIAAKSLMVLDERLGRRRGWIGDVEGGFVAMEKVTI